MAPQHGELVWFLRGDKYCSILRIELEIMPIIGAVFKVGLARMAVTIDDAAPIQVEKLQEVQREADGNAAASKKRKTILTQSLR